MAFRDVVTEARTDVRHNAPRSKFIVVLRGRCVVETSLGDTRELGLGDALLAEDTTGYGHITRRVGNEQRLTLEILVDR